MFRNSLNTPKQSQFMLTPSAGARMACNRLLRPVNRPPQPGNVFNIQIRRQDEPPASS